MYLIIMYFCATCLDTTELSTCQLICQIHVTLLAGIRWLPPADKMNHCYCKMEHLMPGLAAAMNGVCEIHELPSCYGISSSKILFSCKIF